MYTKLTIHSAVLFVYLHTCRAPDTDYAKQVSSYVNSISVRLALEYTYVHQQCMDMVIVTIFHIILVMLSM